jgi:hypothetical protein
VRLEYLCHGVKATELMALILLAEDDPAGTYLFEKRDDLRILWRLSEGGPEDNALAPASLWPLLPPYFRYDK